MSSPTPINFNFPIKRLENPRLILEPFDISQHAAPFVQGCQGHTELFDYLPYGPFASVAEFEAFYTDRLVPNSTETLFAILAKPPPSPLSDDYDDKGNALAGVIGLLNASPSNASIEIGFITILPRFQRTHVTSNAVGLLITYTLDSPPHGLGLRRCQWQTHARNEASRRVAERMGFAFEGVLRFQRVIPSHKKGSGVDLSALPLPEATGAGLGQARDTAVFAHYCDEWAAGKREEVMKVMEPR